MARYRFRNILSVVLFSCNLVLTKEIIYKTLGSKVKLVCPFETTRDITWFGPLKYTIYSVGTDVEPAVSTLVEINKNTTDNKSILIINRLIESIRGEFKCSDGANESEFNLLIKRNPSDLAIVNATGDKITTVQGREHTLECTVTSGQPGGNITWSTDGAVIAKDEPSLVRYIFTPNRSDDRKIFKCTAFNSEEESILESSVHLKVFYIPKITFMPYQTLTVKEGEDAQLICMNDGNDPNTTTVWKRHYTNTNISQNSILSLKNINRTDAGIYTCRVDTKIGVYEKDANIVVQYTFAIVETSLSFQSVVILSLVIVTAVLLVAGMGLYIRRLKQKHRKRMELAINVETPERTYDEIAHYTEISELEIDNVQPTSQENDSSIMAMTNRDIDVVSAEHTSTSSDNERDSAEYLDDGYELPYTTLVVTDQVKDDHVYLTTKSESNYENATSFQTFDYGLACEFLEEDSLSDKTNVYGDHENLNMKYDVNNSNETIESVPQTLIYPQMIKAEYINLSLNQ